MDVAESAQKGEALVRRALPRCPADPIDSMILKPELLFADLPPSLSSRPVFTVTMIYLFYFKFAYFLPRQSFLMYERFPLILSWFYTFQQLPLMPYLIRTNILTPKLNSSRCILFSLGAFVGQDA